MESGDHALAYIIVQQQLGTGKEHSMHWHRLAGRLGVESNRLATINTPHYHGHSTARHGDWLLQLYKDHPCVITVTTAHRQQQATCRAQNVAEQQRPSLYI